MIKFIITLICVFGIISADTITIKFNDKVFVRETPANYEDAMKCIKDMEFLINEFSYSIQKIDNKIDTVVTITNTGVHKIDSLHILSTKYLDSINILNNNIVNKEIELQNLLNNVNNTVCDMKKDIRKEKSNIVGAGFGINYSKSAYGLSNVQELSALGIINIKRLFFGLDIGGFSSDRRLSPKIGGVIGILIK